MYDHWITKEKKSKLIRSVNISIFLPLVRKSKYDIVGVPTRNNLLSEIVSEVDSRSQYLWSKSFLQKKKNRSEP